MGVQQLKDYPDSARPWQLGFEPVIACEIEDLSSLPPVIVVRAGIENRTLHLVSQEASSLTSATL